MPNFQYGITGLSQGIFKGFGESTKSKGNKSIYFLVGLKILF